MPQPEAPAARSRANQGAAYSESAFNGASMPTPARSRFPKLAFFISLLGRVACPPLRLSKGVAGRLEPTVNRSTRQVKPTSTEIASVVTDWQDANFMSLFPNQSISTSLGRWTPTWMPHCV